MTQQTPRADQRRSRREGRRSRRRFAPGRITLLVVGIVVLAALVAAGWLVSRVLVVQDELTQARGVISSMSESGEFSESLPTLGEHAESAASAASDPVWQVAEVLPWAGDNLRAVRLASQSLDLLVNEVGIPATSTMAAGSEQALTDVLGIIQEASPRLSDLSAELSDAVESTSLVDAVAGGAKQVESVVSTAAPVLEFLPDFLGADEARSYLLVFQNNAEALALGGSAASQTLISVDAGAVSIIDQASSTAFTSRNAVVEVPESAQALYGDRYGRYVNLSTSRPDWPSAAEMLRAFWNENIDDTQIDGVISVDPIALQRILQATGPITVGDVEINGDNAARILLSDVYTWWDSYSEPDAPDAFFAAVAGGVLSKISTMDFDIRTMLSSLTRSIDDGDVLLWTEIEDLQQAIDGSKLAGALPTDNETATTVGVYSRNVSASKIDFYLASTIDASLTCEGNTATLSTTMALRLDLDQAAADALPRYVQSYSGGSTRFSTQVFVYAPPGMTVESVTADGLEARAFREGNVDLGRSVAPFSMILQPGQTATVTAVFTGDRSAGPLEVRTNPTVKGTQVNVTDSCG